MKTQYGDTRLMTPEQRVAALADLMKKLVDSKATRQETVTSASERIDKTKAA